MKAFKNSSSATLLFFSSLFALTAVAEGREVRLNEARLGEARVEARPNGEEVDLIEGMSVHKNKISVTINRNFKRKYLKGNFFAEYDPDIDLEQFDYSILSMPFIMNVITIVWISGEVYCVDEMDTELYHSLERVKKVIKIMYPQTSWDGELRPRKLVDHTFTAPQDTKERTALLFSGGIDSTSSVFAHLDKKQLLIMAWGHWDLPLHEQELWQTRRKKTVKFAQKLGNETAFIRSNYTSFLHWEYLSKLTREIPKWRLGAVEGLGWAGLTAPILLAKGYPVLRIASSHTWLYPYPSAATPYIDNNIKMCGLHVLHDQYDFTRIAKIEFIVETCKNKQLEKPFLKICSLEKKSDKNCCNCRKCLSTIMGFYAIGEDPKPYGMPISLATAWSRTHDLLTPTKLNCYTILYFKGVQQRILARIARGEDVPKELLSLAKIDFDKKIAVEERSQSKINRQDLRSCLPELEVPALVDGMDVGEKQ